MRTLFLLALSLSTFSVFCADEKPMSAEDREKFKLLHEKFSAMHCSVATLYKVSPAKMKEEAELAKHPNLLGYKILAEHPLTAKELVQTQALLLNEKTYADTGAKRFDPGMALKFYNGSEEAVFVICLGCNWVHWKIGKDFNVLALSKEAEKNLGLLYNSYFTAKK